jgi:hypothetical protein
LRMVKIQQGHRASTRSSNNKARDRKIIERDTFNRYCDINILL